MEWELIDWGDGVMRLKFEDSYQGKDSCILIHPDGRVEKVHYDGDTDTETFEPINLVDELRQALTDWRKQQDEWNEQWGIRR